MILRPFRSSRVFGIRLGILDSGSLLSATALAVRFAGKGSNGVVRAPTFALVLGNEHLRESVEQTERKNRSGHPQYEYDIVRRSIFAADFHEPNGHCGKGYCPRNEGREKSEASVNVLHDNLHLVKGCALSETWSQIRSPYFD